MAGWNYRVMEFSDERTGETWRAIHEVYYENGLPVMYSEEPASVVGDVGTAHGLEWTLDRMKEALQKPVLTEEDFRTQAREAQP